MKKNIHQILAGASCNDAITKYALLLKKKLSKINCSGEIFAPFTSVEKGLQNDILPLHKINECSDNKDDVIYHYSIGSIATDYFSKFSGSRIICYHNITPYEFFLPFSDALSTLLRQGREELFALASKAHIAIADSDFNKYELLSMGYKNVTTLPLFIDEKLKECKESKKTAKKLSNKKFNFLFVGRIVPNKGFLNLLKVFSIFHNCLDKDSMLYCIGNKDVVPSYFVFLNNKLKEFNIQNAVIFTGSVNNSELISYYKNSSAFLCFSEHEGFCLPLIESMCFKLPIFALDRTVVSETLNGTGVLIKEVDIKKTPELIWKVLENKELCKNICEEQTKRLKYFSMENFEKRLFEWMKTYL